MSKAFRVELYCKSKERASFNLDIDKEDWFRGKWTDASRITIKGADVVCGFDLSEFDSFNMKTIDLDEAE